MAIVRSAGILLHRGLDTNVEVFLGHMGGPFWARKDAAAWSIPKGEFGPDEDALAAAVREFAEEIGIPAPSLDYELLGEFRQSSGKVVTVFAAACDEPIRFVESNTFETEWPPRSGRLQSFPEIDRADWFPLARARELLVKGQIPVIGALEARIAGA